MGFADQVGNEKIYEEQTSAASEVLSNFSKGNRSCLLIAQPQQGKTGVAIYVIHRFIADAKVKNLPYKVLYITNLSSKVLKSQTYTRLRNAHLYDVDVLHLDDLKGRKLVDESKNGSWPENMLIVLDECHYAIDSNGPIDVFFTENGIFYGEDPSTWTNKNVKLLSISATPFAHNIQKLKNTKSFSIVPLPMSENYYSLEQMHLDGRLLQSGSLIGRGSITDFGSKIIDDFVENCKQNGNGYFVIRMIGNNNNVLKQAISEKYGKSIRIEGYGTKSDDDCDIGELDACLSQCPGQPTIILIRGSLRAGKTLTTTQHIRGWCEPKKSKSDAKLQALRPLGYESGGHSKFDDTFPVYCNISDIKNEIDYYNSVIDYIESGNLGDVIPGGIRNKPSHTHRFEYEQLVFENRPTVDQVVDEMEKRGIAEHNDLKRGEEFVAVITIGGNSHERFCDQLINNRGYGSGGRKSLIHVDMANPDQLEDWNRLEQEKPHLIGKYVYAAKTNKKVKRDIKGLLSEKAIFNR